MYYYDPDNKSPRRWAMIATAVYGVLLAGSFALVSVCTMNRMRRTQYITLL